MKVWIISKKFWEGWTRLFESQVKTPLNIVNVAWQYMTALGSRMLMMDASVFSCDQAALWMVQSVCLSIRPSVRLSVCHTFWPCSHHRIIMKFYLLLPMTEVTPMQKVKVRAQRSRSQRSRHNLAVSGSQLQFEFTYHDEMMHRDLCCLWEVPYYFSRSSVKFQGPTAEKKSLILTQIGRFRTETPVSIRQWLQNDAQSLK